VALAYLGVIDENETYVRSPLLAIESEESERINQALIAAGMK
jgi:hypothetical protein